MKGHSLHLNISLKIREVDLQNYLKSFHSGPTQIFLENILDDILKLASREPVIL